VNSWVYTHIHTQTIILHTSTEAHHFKLHFGLMRHTSPQPHFTSSACETAVERHLLYLSLLLERV